MKIVHDPAVSTQLCQPDVVAVPHARSSRSGLLPTIGATGRCGSRILIDVRHAEVPGGGRTPRREGTNARDRIEHSIAVGAPISASVMTA